MKSFLKKIIPWRLVNLFWHLPKSVLASFFYGFPAQKLTVIAIAGTKGKTSTAYFLSHFLDRAHIRHALFSTAAIKVAGQESLNTLKLTSPTPFFLQKTLRHALRRGCTHAAIEVSSHALQQYRVWGIHFEVVAITNLMSDHLEYHENAQQYRAIHARLISQHTKLLILNADDPNEQEFHSLRVPKQFISKHDSDYAALASTPIPIVGDYNLMNIYAAICSAHALGISRESITQSLPTLHNAPGRMEYIAEGQPFDVIVDYAHSPDSLAAFFNAIQQYIQKRCIAVFGACGDRDPSMRPLMGRVLDDNADMIIITNDDTYSENPEIIASHLRMGIVHKTPESLFTILDRRSAIQKALSLARAGDTLCILGKGAETFHILGSKKIPWDDRAVARELLRNGSGSA